MLCNRETPFFLRHEWNFPLRSAVWRSRQCLEISYGGSLCADAFEAHKPHGRHRAGEGSARLKKPLYGGLKPMN